MKVAFQDSVSGQRNRLLFICFSGTSGSVNRTVELRETEILFAADGADILDQLIHLPETENPVDVRGQRPVGRARLRWPAKGY